MADPIRAALERAIPPDWRELCRELLDLADRLYKQSVTQPHNQVLRLSNGLHPIPIGNDILVQDVCASFTLDRARTALAIHSPAPGLVPDTDTVPALAAEPVDGLSPKEIEAQEAFTQMRDEVLGGVEGLDSDQVNSILHIIDNYTPEWV